MWWGRRRISHDEPVQIPSRSPQAIFALALNFSRSCKRNSGIRRHGWEKPPKGFVKLNIDAAFSIDSLSGATGAVIHDDHGIFIAGSCCGLPHVANAASVEARALRDGLILAGQVGCNKLVINSDCMEVIERMRNEGNSLGAAAEIYEEIYEECSFLARGFASVKFIHCPRESNGSPYFSL
jgi:ribonuclease HI